MMTLKTNLWLVFSAFIAMTVMPVMAQSNPPTAPIGVSVSDGTYLDKVRVTWSAVSNATSYIAYRATTNNSGAAHGIGTNVTTTLDDTTASAGTMYYYWVKARNAAGTSGFSASDSGYRRAADPPPTAPTGVSASDGTYLDKVRVTWSAVSNATSYIAYRATTNNSVAAIGLGTSVTTTFDDTTVTAGTWYYYWVKAINGAGASTFSVFACGYCPAQIPPPSAPVGVSASDGTFADRVRIAWNTVPGAAGYKIFRGLNAGSSVATEIGAVAKPLFDDLTVASDIIYYYRVKAVNPAGASAFSTSDSGYYHNIIPSNTVVTPHLWINGKQSSDVMEDEVLKMIPGQTLIASVGLDTTIYVEADWWVVASSPMGNYVYVVEQGAWLPFDPKAQQASYQGPLCSIIAPYEIFRLNTAWLPEGRYVFYFGVDGIQNGQLDLDVMSYEEVPVDIRN